MVPWQPFDVVRCIFCTYTVSKLIFKIIYYTVYVNKKSPYSTVITQ